MKLFNQTWQSMSIPYIAALCLCFPTAAKTISPEEALHVASSGTILKTPARGGAPVLTHITNTSNPTLPAYYIYNKPQGGFIILSAEDELPLVIAEVDEGSFDMDKMPENMKWWLGEYVREIDWYHANRENILKAQQASRAPHKTKLKVGKENVEPFVTTQWSQDEPYNNECPLTDDGRSVTGCVSTAMAQCLKYYNYPERGFGEHSYTDKGRPRSFDYSSTEFAWDKMLDSYAHGYTQAQASAVATLMVACGIGVNSQYAADQTGAVSLRIAHAYRKFFGYSKATSFVSRDFTSLTRWVQLIYDEMAAERPVTYSGLGPGGGHEFVADGYREGDLFHINWGWGNIFNGYFRLTALNPTGVGIGGGMGAFNSDQDAVVQLAPPGKDEGLYELTPLYIKGGVGISYVQNSDSQGATVRIGFNSGGLYANSVDDITGQPGVFIYNEYGEEMGWYPSPNFVELKGMGNRGWIPGETGVDVFIPRLKEGKYRIFLGFESTRLKPQIIPVLSGDTQCISMEVDADGEMNLENVGFTKIPEIEITKVFLPDSFYPTIEQDVKLDTSTGEGGYNGYLRMIVTKPGSDEELLMIPVAAEIDPYMLQFVNFSTAINLEPGDYEIHFLDYLGDSISKNFAIRVSPDEMAGTSIITTDGTDAEYFDVQGIKVNGSLHPGIYIEKRGMETRKIVVK